MYQIASLLFSCLAAVSIIHFQFLYHTMSRGCAVAQCARPLATARYCAIHTNEHGISKVSGGLENMVLLPKIGLDDIFNNIKLRFNLDLVWVFVWCSNR